MQNWGEIAAFVGVISTVVTAGIAVGTFYLKAVISNRLYEFEKSIQVALKDNFVEKQVAELKFQGIETRVEILSSRFDRMEQRLNQVELNQAGKKEH